MLVVLDLDNTLVYVTRRWQGRCPDDSFRLFGGVYHVYLRPGLRQFLSFLLAHFEVGVWTAGTRAYARCVLRRVLGAEWRRALRLFWHRAQCVCWRGQYAKDLRRLPSEAVLIDDNVAHLLYNRQFEHDRKALLLCAGFYGHPHDVELGRIARFFRRRLATTGTQRL